MYVLPWGDEYSWVMNDFLILIIVVSLISCMLSLLLPESEMKKSFMFLAGAVVVFSVFLPLCELFDDIDSIDISFSENSYSGVFSEENEEIIYSSVKSGFENLLNENIIKAYKEIKEIKVELITENGQYKPGKIIVVLNKSTEIKDFIKNDILALTDVMCEVAFIEDF